MSARTPKGKRPEGTAKDAAPSGDDAPVIPDRSSDDSDEGWDRSDSGDSDDSDDSDDSGDSGDSDDERYLRDRPPHWQ